MNRSLPGIDASVGAQRFFWLTSIAAAFAALAILGLRIASRVDPLQWWVPIALFAGVAIADFGSGLVHWGADTWGRDDLPVIGERLLSPFRIHHINPDDFLRRRFVDANGDSALLTVPLLAGLHTVPLETPWGGPLAVSGLAFCVFSAMTNQIHQWAHMAAPPRPIARLQEWGLLLEHHAHAAHHQRPYDVHYCINTGWCNRPLEAVGFFRRLESTITRMTGVRPRNDDQRYEARYGGATAHRETISG